MAKVKIISGTYGEPVGNSVKPRNKQSKPFELPDKEAQRIVDLGIAAFVIEIAESDSNSDINAEGADLSEKQGLDDKTTNYPVEDDTPENGENEGDIPEYSENSSVNDLRAIGKTYGLTFKVGTTKAEMIAELDRYFYDNTEEFPHSDVEGLI